MFWIWRFLTSRNTGIVLLSAVSLVLLIGAMLPNPDILPAEELIRLRIESPYLVWLGENFNSMKVGRSYVFGLIGLLLIVSTTFCSIDRVIKKIRSGKIATDVISSDRKKVSSYFSLDAVNATDCLIEMLKKSGWKIQGGDTTETGILSATKGNTGFWGSIFFHAILITLIAGLIVYYFSAFYANFVITEGQRLELTRENLSTITRMPVFGINLPRIAFRFNSFSDEYYNDYSATDFTADFDIEDMETGRSWKQVIKVNEPFKYGGIDFLMILQGYSPNFILYKNDIPVFDSYVALNYVADSIDTFEIRDFGLSVAAEFFPDMKRDEKGGIYTASPRPRNPYFGLEITGGNRKLFKGLVGVGKSVSFGPFRLEVRELKHWITINLVRETGLGFFFFCAMIGLAGLLVRVMDPEKRITAVIKGENSGSVISLYYTGKHFDGILKEEISRIMVELREGDKNVKD